MTRLAKMSKLLPGVIKYVIYALQKMSFGMSLSLFFAIFVKFNSRYALRSKGFGLDPKVI